MNDPENADARPAELPTVENTPAPAVIMPSETLIPDTPNAWFKRKFNGLSEKYGEPIHEENNKAGKPVVRDFGEDFFAATLGKEGYPDAPTVYLPNEDKFLGYSPTEGVFIERREAHLAGRISDLFFECARACEKTADVKKLAFDFRDTAGITGVIKRAKSHLAVAPDYFAGGTKNLIICHNGALHLKEKLLMPFSPQYRRRNKLGVNYDPATKCPVFLETLMRPALGPEDLDLLQRWCGLALLGNNYAQKLLILSGTAGGGKGTFVRVLHGIIGGSNIGTLRTGLLQERFELSRMLGKTLLYGPDAAENFLSCKGASLLKALTGGDPINVELKGSNESPEITGSFNIIVTCNSRLIVRLEGDTAAWQRRLAIIEYRNPASESKIADLSERIIRDEGPGVLNWMLEGLDKLRADDFQLYLSENQQRRVKDLLLESDSVKVFAEERIGRDGTETLIVADCFERYLEYCGERGWFGIAKARFGPVVADMIGQKHGVAQRNDIKDANGKSQRGWKGLKLKSNP